MKGMVLVLVSKVILPIVVLGFAVLVSLQILQSKPDASSGRKPETAMLAVESLVLEARQFSLSLAAFGTVHPARREEVHTLVSGQVLAFSPGFKAGGYVREGETLVRLDPVDYELALQVAKSDLAQAELALAEEQARSEQARRDWKKQKSAQPANDFALRIPQLKAAKVNLETAQAQLQLAELNLERTALKASFSGRIQERFVELGAVVNPGSKLADGYATNAAEVRLAIASKDLAYVDLPSGRDNTEGGAKVTFINTLVDPVEHWQGRLVRTEAAIDAASQQLYVVARIEDPFVQQGESRKGLKIGQFLEASISGRLQRQAIVIPNRAIYQGAYVYVVDAGTISRRAVTISWSDRNVSLISNGLQAGEHLVMTPLGQVTSGTLVTETLVTDTESIGTEKFIMASDKAAMDRPTDAGSLAERMEP